MYLKQLATLFTMLLVVLPLAAQDDVPLSEIINYDDEVTDTLTERAFWDWWRIEADAGDEIVIEMAALESLEPLLGILAPEGGLVTRSDDGVPGGGITLEYTVPEAGEYTIVATRVGNENGTSTGPYGLRVRRANAPDSRVNSYLEVTFRCQDFEATHVATVEFAEDVDQASLYLISVYGFDGFEPVIRVRFSEVDVDDCSRDSQGVPGNVYAVPGEAAVTIEGETSSAAQLLISGAAQAGTVTLTIGGVKGTTGRYVAVIDGFTIGERDLDTVHIGQGPLAATQPLVIYMIGGQQERLDPSLMLLNDPTDDEGIICDDAGRRGCEGVPSPLGLSVELAEVGATIEADRFDAGITLPPGPPALRDLELGSFRDNTTGRYALVLLGELPGDDADS